MQQSCNTEVLLKHCFQTDNKQTNKESEVLTAILRGSPLRKTPLMNDFTPTVQVEILPARSILTGIYLDSSIETLYFCKKLPLRQKRGLWRRHGGRRETDRSKNKTFKGKGRTETSFSVSSTPRKTCITDNLYHFTKCTPYILYIHI